MAQAATIEELEKQVQSKHDLLALEQRTLAYDQQLLHNVESSDILLGMFMDGGIAIPKQVVADHFARQYLTGRITYEQMLAEIKAATDTSNALKNSIKEDAQIRANLIKQYTMEVASLESELIKAKSGPAENAWHAQEWRLRDSSPKINARNAQLNRDSATRTERYTVSESAFTYHIKDIHGNTKQVTNEYEFAGEVSGHNPAFIKAGAKLEIHMKANGSFVVDGGRFSGSAITMTWKGFKLVDVQPPMKGGKDPSVETGRSAHEGRIIDSDERVVTLQAPEDGKDDLKLIINIGSIAEAAVFEWESMH
jgi:hypothetical protein